MLRLSNSAIGIDLGTANTLLYVQHKGITLRQPSVVAIDRASGEIVEAGAPAYKLLGRAPANIEIVRPIRDGVVHNAVVAEKFLAHCLEKATGHYNIRKPRVLVCVPSIASEDEKQQLIDAALSAGASSVLLIEEPVAAGIGAGLPVDDPYGYMVVDIGGGTTDIAVVSMGKTITSGSLRTGGDAFTRAITEYIRRHRGMEIGERTAESIKMQVGTTVPLDKPLALEVTGKSMSTGLPQSFIVTSEETMEAFVEPVSAILSAIHAVFEQTPPEMAADIYDHGVIMTGGGALLYGIDYLLSERLKAPVYTAEDALSCVALGIGKVLDNWDAFERSTIAVS